MIVIMFALIASFAAILNHSSITTKSDILEKSKFNSYLVTAAIYPKMVLISLLTVLPARMVKIKLGFGHS